MVAFLLTQEDYGQRLIKLLSTCPFFLFKRRSAQLYTKAYSLKQHTLQVLWILGMERGNNLTTYLIKQCGQHTKPWSYYINVSNVHLFSVFKQYGLYVHQILLTVSKEYVSSLNLTQIPQLNG